MTGRIGVALRVVKILINWGYNEKESIGKRIIHSQKANYFLMVRFGGPISFNIDVGIISYSGDIMGLSLNDLEADGRKAAQGKKVMVDGEIKTNVAQIRRFSGEPTPGELTVMIVNLEEKIDTLVKSNEARKKEMVELKQLLDIKTGQKTVEKHDSLAVIAEKHTRWVHSMGRGQQPILDALKSIAGEVVEAMAEVGPEGVILPPEFADELSDIILRTLTIFVELGIDVEEAIERKMKINERRGQK